MTFPRLAVLVVLSAIASPLCAAQFRFLTQSIPTPVSSNLPYSARVLTANAEGTVTFSVSTGGLPTGLVLNSATGVISGRPVNPENLASVPFSFTISASDGVTSIQKSFTIVVNRVDFNQETENVSLLTNSLSDGEIGASYSTPISREKGIGPFVFGAAGLPPGLSLDSQDAVIEGTPTAAGTFQVTLTVTDLADNTQATNLIPLTIRPTGSLLRFSNSILDNGEVGSAYTDTWTLVGATSAASFSAENLPLGLSVDANSGVVSGQPMVAGLFRVVQIASVGDISIRSEQFITIAPSATSTFTWSNYEIPIAFVGKRYEGDNPRLMSTQSPGPDNGVIYSVTGLPASLAYNAPSASRLSGIPTLPGSFAVTFLALSPQQETIVYSTNVIVLNRNGGDVSSLPANLFVSTQNVSNSTKPGKATWQGTYYYNADRRTGKAFDPATESFSVTLGERTISIPPGSFTVKNDSYTFKSDKGVVPIVNVTINADKQEIKLKSSSDTFTQSVANATLSNTITLGGDRFSLTQNYDKNAKLIVTKGYDSSGFVVKTSNISIPGPNLGSLSVSGSLGDPKFVYEPGQSNTTLRIRVLNAEKEVLDYLVSSLVSVKITQDGDRRFYKLSTKDFGLTTFTYDSKTGAFNFSFVNRTLSNISAIEEQLSLELQFGDLVYFTNFSVFSDKPTKYAIAIP